MGKMERKFHAAPQMRLEALALYAMTASAPSRHAIVRAEKYYDTDIPPSYYRDIKRGVIRHLCDPNREGNGLLEAANRIIINKTAKEYERKRVQNNIAGLRHLHACRDQFITDDLAYAKLPPVGHWTIGGVKVIASPVVVLGGLVRGKFYRGCLKLCLGKTKPVSDTVAEHIGAGLLEFLSVVFPNDDLRSKYVTIVDVFQEKAFSAPEAVLKRMKSLHSAGVEIFRLWDAI